MDRGKQPGHEVDGADGHADAEHDAGEQALLPLRRTRR